MTSLRARLISSTLIGITLLLTAGGVLIYTMVERRLLGELDRSLASVTTTAAAAVSKEIVRLSHTGSWAEGITLPLESPGDLYQVWLEDGTLVAGSAELGGASLTRGLGSGGEVGYADQVLNGRRLRIAGLPSTAAPPPRGGRPRGDPPRDDRPGDGRGPGPRGGREGPPDGPRGERPPPPPDRAAALPDFEVVVARDLRDLHGTLAQVRALLLGSWAAACLGCAAILFFGVRRGLAPVARLRAELEAVDENDPSHRFALEGAPEELVPVIQQLDSLMRRIGAALAQERAFSANAAHELRTPLAGLRSTAELALMRERSPDEYRAALAGSLAITDQMQTLVEQLLDLTRPPAPERFESTALAALLESAWADAAPTAAARDIELESHVDPEVSVLAEPGLAQRIVSNLIENAVRYADPGSQVTTSAFADDGRVVLEIINPAAAAPEDAAERAFDLFWRADRARTADDRSFGLGLPLCRRLAEALGGTLVATLENGTFRVLLELDQPGGDGATAGP